VKKINLGSGTACLDDWVNIDNSFNARLAKYPWLRNLAYKTGLLPRNLYDIPWSKHIKTIIVHDVRKGLPFEDQSVDFIYTSHLIEHLKVTDAVKLLLECLRVLKSGALIRVVTPDLELFAKRYINKNKQKQMNGVEGDSLPIDEFLEVLNSNDCRATLRKLFDPPHRHIYDQFSLKALLKSCGFVDIFKRDFRQGEMPDIEFLDNRPEESLYMEARRPF
jgi:SAM-dependent methyltransferase